jgi:hypothetical protein
VGVVEEPALVLALAPLSSSCVAPAGGYTAGVVVVVVMIPPVVVVDNGITTARQVGQTARDSTRIARVCWPKLKSGLALPRCLLPRLDSNQQPFG